MKEIESEYDGIVEAVLIGNGQMVEYRAAAVSHSTEMKRGVRCWELRK